jgi:hypothetical protein
MYGMPRCTPTKPMMALGGTAGGDDEEWKYEEIKVLNYMSKITLMSLSYSFSTFSSSPFITLISDSSII